MLAIIINPKSGKNYFRSQRKYLFELLRHRHQPFTYRVTQYPDHAIECARELVEKGYDQLLVLGGDGTLSEVINGIMRADISPEERAKIRFGLMPRGTGNDCSNTQPRSEYSIRRSSPSHGHHGKGRIPSESSRYQRIQAELFKRHIDPARYLIAVGDHVQRQPAPSASLICQRSFHIIPAQPARNGPALGTEQRAQVAVESFYQWIRYRCYSHHPCYHHNHEVHKRRVGHPSDDSPSGRNDA